MGCLRLTSNRARVTGVMGCLRLSSNRARVMGCLRLTSNRARVMGCLRLSSNRSGLVEGCLRWSSSRSGMVISSGSTADIWRPDLCGTSLLAALECGCCHGGGCGPRTCFAGFPGFSLLSGFVASQSVEHETLNLRVTWARARRWAPVVKKGRPEVSRSQRRR